jgi:hypothetical protein
VLGHGAPEKQYPPDEEFNPWVQVGAMRRRAEGHGCIGQSIVGRDRLGNGVPESGKGGDTDWRGLRTIQSFGQACGADKMAFVMVGEVLVLHFVHRGDGVTHSGGDGATNGFGCDGEVSAEVPVVIHHLEKTPGRLPPV